MIERDLRLAVISCFLCAIFTISGANLSYGQYIYGSGLDVSNISPLMTAVNSSDVEGVKFFAKAGRAALNKKNIGGATALHLAARTNNLEITQILIESGADLNVQDNDGWTPLMRAAINGNSETVSKLLSSGAEANKVNSLKETAIIHATNSGCAVCVESILNYFDYKKTDPKLIEDQFNEAFAIANNRGDKTIKEILTKYKDRAGREDYPGVFNDNQQFSEVVTKEPLMIEEGGSVAAYKAEVVNNGGLKNYVLKRDLQDSEPENEESLPIVVEKSNLLYRFSNGAVPTSMKTVVTKSFVKRKVYLFIKGPSGSVLGQESLGLVEQKPVRNKKFIFIPISDAINQNSTENSTGSADSSQNLNKAVSHKEIRNGKKFIFKKIKEMAKETAAEAAKKENDSTKPDQLNNVGSKKFILNKIKDESKAPIATMEGPKKPVVEETKEVQSLTNLTNKNSRKFTLKKSENGNKKEEVKEVKKPAEDPVEEKAEEVESLKSKTFSFTRVKKPSKDSVTDPAADEATSLGN